MKFGRSKKQIDSRFIEIYKEWKSGNMSAVEAMKKVDMKPNTFYRRVSDYEAGFQKWSLHCEDFLILEGG